MPSPIAEPPRHVRFLVHGAERSGPPIYLLRLLQQWKLTGSSLDAEVVVARPGPLLDGFRRASVTRTARLDRRSPEQIVGRILDAAHLGDIGGAVGTVATRMRVGGSEARITVVNGATQPTADLLGALNPSGEVVLIAHELSTGWESNIDDEARTLLLDRVERYLAVSVSVSDYLTTRLGIPADLVTVVRPPVPAPACDGALRWPRDGADTYTRGSRPGEPIVVGGAGVHDWRKAPELWLQLAALVRERLGGDDVRFRWFGGHAPDALPSWPVRHELGHLELDEVVEFRGEVEDLQEELRSVDLFASTAREDAYPLVCAEACAAGVPVLSFVGGGAEELIQDSGCGATFRYPDLVAMADEIARLAEDRDEREALGRRGQSFAHEFLDPARIAQQVERWIVSGTTPR